MEKQMISNMSEYQKSLSLLKLRGWKARLEKPNRTIVPIGEWENSELLGFGYVVDENGDKIKSARSDFVFKTEALAIRKGEDPEKMIWDYRTPNLYKKNNMWLAWGFHLWALDNQEISEQYAQWWSRTDEREIWREGNAQAMWLDKILQIASTEL